MARRGVLSVLIGVAFIVGGVMLMGDFILQFLRFAIGLLLFFIGLGLVLGGHKHRRVRRI